MKRTVPLLITAVVGFVLIGSAFIPAVESWGEETLIWFNVLAGIAFLLGGASLVGAQLRKISARRPGWGYALVTLVSFFIMLAVGMFKLGVQPAANQEYFGETFAEVAVLQLPRISFDATIPDDIRQEPLPASVRRQVVLTDSGIQVAGWLSTSQIDDLSDAGHTLDWKCTVERLALAAAPPAKFQGRLTYRPDHGVVSFKGVMTDAERVELKSLAPESDTFAQAIDDIAERSLRKVAVTGPGPPPGFQLPPQLADRTTISGSQIEWTGPMSLGERAALTSGSLRSRIAFPLSAQGRKEFVSQLEASGALNEEQKVTLESFLSRNWATDLTAALNMAGTPEPEKKTACELVEERNSGVTDLQPERPAKPVVQLNAGQKEAIASFVQGESRDWSAFATKMKSAGTLTDAQAAVIDSFRDRLPTVGRRNRQLFEELLAAGPLTPQQHGLLLKDYQVEVAWEATVGRIFEAAHSVKYPWSGEFDQQGGQFWWMFEYLFQPIQSMMFALLAFYVASSAFRAFRAKNLEATLLLATAFIVLLGRTYYGTQATAWLPKDSPLRLENISVDIMRVFNTAGNRAIMIGIALGIAATSLKILLGIDRSHIGGKD